MSELALQLIAQNKKTKAPFLDLGNCGLKNYLPEELLDCVWLKRLNFGYYYRDEENKKWAETGNSKKRGQNIFSGKELTILENLRSLQTLDLSSTQISNISFLEKLISLQTLDLSSNKILDYSFLENLSKLQSLDLSSTHISDVSSGVVPHLEKLVGLQSLYLRSNQISDYSFLENLIGLQSLDLSSNQISDYSFFDNLIDLQSLDLSHNKISDISFLEKLSHLQSLDLSNNKISDFSFLEKLSHLQSLKLSHNQISDISFLEKLSHLQSLNISHNQILDISFLEKLSHLQSLNLSNNKISGISFLEKLSHLQSLNLSTNKISDISFLENLSNIKSLYLNYNQISDISNLLPLINRGLEIKFEKDFFGELNDEIVLKGNPIINPPLEIVRQGREAVIEYFEGKRKPLNECKLIFVGDGKVGKTSLMRRVVYDTFDKQEATTHGINKIAWEEIENVNRDKIKVNLWDFGGQHIQHSLHQFFFTKRVIYVLVLDPRNDLKANYWLDQIEKLGCDSEILIAYNWKHAADKQAEFMSNFYELRKKYPKLSEPFILSCETGEGVEVFKKQLISSVLKNENLKDEYLVKWFNIKQRLEKEVSVGQNYITYDTYQTWCVEEDYSEPKRQKNLLEILNRIGSIVFFDKPKLEDWQVLNPEWITTGAYSILVSEQNRVNKGHLSWQDLKEIFKEEKEIFSDKTIRIKYTENQFQFIIELMLEYDLCQRNPFQAHSFLIPSAFGEKPDKDYDNAKDNARVYRLQFESPFEMLIIHRFIAKNLSKIIDKDYWQSGIYIKHPTSETYALVETNLYSKRIDCWIKGINIRGFWEIIRVDFKEILSIYHNFTYKEEVLYQKDGQEVFLPYDEMLNALSDGIKIIDYDSKTRLRNIDVLAVLDLFESHESSINSVERVPIADQRIFEEKVDNNLTEIFFSYAWDKAGEIKSKEKIVNDLYQSLNDDGFKVIIDKEDLSYRESISQFMDRIGDGDIIVIALSDAYLKSINCMYEFYEIFKKSRSDKELMRERIFPIRVESLNLSKPSVLDGYFEHWENLEKEWEELIRKRGLRIGESQQRKYKRIKAIASELGDFLDFLSDMNAKTKDELSSDNFAEIKKAIENRTKQ